MPTIRTVAAVSFLIASMVAWPAEASPIGELAGYWTGVGSITLSGGNTERVKCAVTYRVDNGGGEIRQSIRCAGADYIINATADLRVKGEVVSGSWEEKTYAATGEVSGRYTAEGFVLSIRGANFTAAMNVTLSACKQSISIAPKGLDVTHVSIGLAKC